jgi:hypothetical protein
MQDPAPRMGLVIVCDRCRIAPTTAYDNVLRLKYLNAELRQRGFTVVMDPLAALTGSMIVKA